MSSAKELKRLQPEIQLGNTYKRSVQIFGNHQRNV